MSLDQDGYLIVKQLFDAQTTDALKSAFAEADVARSKRGEETFGARNVLTIPEVQAIAQDTKLQALLGDDMRAVRGIFFDKPPGANWPVAWHQDLTLALRERRDTEGWTNWTIKRGVTHAQPPSVVLARMVTMRLHLDDCAHDNGPLRVIPGSHVNGRLSRSEVTARVLPGEVTITAAAGDALFMRPLLLHASSPACNPSHRRVLHLEFAPVAMLPHGIDWAEAV
jgi:ectoine hydroxylase-related dioxygenase (phytanoyl-CoA dioxygenase family)